MFGIINFETFLITSFILTLTPGADTMYILGKSITLGKKAGILSALGSSTGGLVHCLLATLGLSVILAKSGIAFELVKYLGAAYLIFLGIKSLKAKSNKQHEFEKVDTQNNYRKLYISGILTNMLNPKVALFYLAFLPQFVDPNNIQSSLPFLILGMTFLLLVTVWSLVIVLFASKLSDRIRKNHKIKVWLDRIAGGIFILLGIKIAISRQ